MHCKLISQYIYSHIVVLYLVKSGLLIRFDSLTRHCLIMAYYIVGSTNLPLVITLVSLLLWTVGHMMLANGSLSLWIRECPSRQLEFLGD